MRAEEVLGVCWEVKRELPFVDSFLLPDSEELSSRMMVGRMSQK